MLMGGQAAVAAIKAWVSSHSGASLMSLMNKEWHTSGIDQIPGI